MSLIHTSRWDGSHRTGHSDTSPQNRYPLYATPVFDTALTDTRSCAFLVISGK